MKLLCTYFLQPREPSSYLEFPMTCLLKNFGINCTPHNFWLAFITARQTTNGKPLFPHYMVADLAESFHWVTGDLMLCCTKGATSWEWCQIKNWEPLLACKIFTSSLLAEKRENHFYNFFYDILFSYGVYPFGYIIESSSGFVNPIRNQETLLKGRVFFR